MFYNIYTYVCFVWDCNFMWVCLCCVDNFIGLVLTFSLRVLFLHIPPLFCMFKFGYNILFDIVCWLFLLSLRTLENEILYGLYLLFYFSLVFLLIQKLIFKRLCILYTYVKKFRMSCCPLPEAIPLNYTNELP